MMMSAFFSNIIFRKTPARKNKKKSCFFLEGYRRIHIVHNRCNNGTNKSMSFVNFNINSRINCT